MFFEREPGARFQFSSRLLSGRITVSLMFAPAENLRGVWAPIGAPPNGFRRNGRGQLLAPIHRWFAPTRISALKRSGHTEPGIAVTVRAADPGARCRAEVARTIKPGAASEDVGSA